MSLGSGNIGITARNLGKIIGRNKGYAVRDVLHSPAGELHFSLGGRPSTGGIITDNQVPAMGSGLMKLLKTNITEDSGGNLVPRTYVNGVQAILPAIDFVGIHDTDLLDRSFVKDDLIRLSYQKANATGQLRTVSWIELDYPSNELWGYSGILDSAQGSDRFTPMFGVTNTNIVTSRGLTQRSLGKSGVIKDFVYYGTAPAGTGTCIISVEKNAVSAFDSPDLPVTGVSIHRFDNIDIPFNATDLLNIKANGRVGTNMDGIYGVRIVFD